MQPKFFTFCVLCFGLLLSAAFSGYAQVNPLSADSITVAIAPEYDQVSKSHRRWFGENYRQLWAAPVKMKVFHLNKEKGGMTILKKGGGEQTRSLRLQDASGKEWVLRTIQKEPEMALPEELRGTVAVKVVQDQISASHPYGALAVPPLALALNIPHAKPEVVYLPDDPALGQYREEFAGQVYLFEEWEPTGGTDTDNTEKVLEKLTEDNENRVNQRLVLRARLLDMITGDWDRHDDQWRWIENEDQIGDYYLPVPRDRDQIFFINQGIIPNVGSRKWILPKFQGFSEEIRDVKGYNYNARHFDRIFLAALDKNDWQEEIAYVQQNLTDAVIETAVRQMPLNIYALSGEEIARKMRSRRNSIDREAITYYNFLAREVDIPASDKKEHIEVNYSADNQVGVAVYAVKNNGSRGRTIYQRTFDPEVTNEIRIYGLGGEDVFSVNGTGRPDIKVRLIGGSEPDKFAVAEDVRNKRNLYIYDRKDEQNTLPDASLARIKTANDTIVNSYAPNAFKYNVLMPQALVGYNLDDGVILGAGFIYTRHGFRKEPFAARHRFIAGRALATNATFFRYNGYFTEVIGKNSLSIDLDGRAPNNTSNFFGVGNETQFVKEGRRPILRYRTRYDLVTTQVKLHRKVGTKFTVNGGIIGQYYSTDSADNAGRFINVYNAQRPEEDVFSRKFFGGLVAGFALDTRDDAFLTSQGVYWNTTITAMRQIDEPESGYGQVLSEFSFYLNPKGNKNLVLANRFGGGTTVGNPNFYQMLYLGGNSGLRGYRNFRFAGESMAYHNLELRVKLLDFTTILLPGSLGLIGFNDVGRVWAEGENSKKWHNGIGGGFYLIPSNLILVHAVVGFSREEVLPFVSAGFRF